MILAGVMIKSWMRLRALLSNSLAAVTGLLLVISQCCSHVMFSGTGFPCCVNIACVLSGHLWSAAEKLANQVGMPNWTTIAKRSRVCFSQYADVPLTVFRNLYPSFLLTSCFKFCDDDSISAVRASPTELTGVPFRRDIWADYFTEFLYVL